MALLSTLLSFTYPPPPSVFVNAITIASVVAIPFIGLSELRGVHLQYSKFWNINTRNKDFKTVSGRTGMVVLYLPALLAGVVSLGMFPDTGLRLLVLRLALMVHFLKRDLEVLFLHKFSPRMAVDLMLVISFGYFLITTTMIYSLHLCRILFPEPSIDLTHPGVKICSNMSALSVQDHGFRRHRLHLPNDFAVALNMIGYLAGRSYATGRWYKSKFEDFPEGIKALIPYIF